MPFLNIYKFICLAIGFFIKVQIFRIKKIEINENGITIPYMSFYPMKSPIKSRFIIFVQTLLPVADKRGGLSISELRLAII